MARYRPPAEPEEVDEHAWVGGIRLLLAEPAGTPGIVDDWTVFDLLWEVADEATRAEYRTRSGRHDQRMAPATVPQVVAELRPRPPA